MREQLAYVEVIKSLSPIKDADKIERATVLGWECVVLKGQFKVGDNIIFCEVDSVLPDIECFDFLREKKFRIRTIKLKSQISQGLVLSLSTINDIDPAFDISKLKVGDDCTSLLGITKYDPESALDEPEVEQVKRSWIANRYSYYKWKLLGIKPIKKGSFPSDVPKTNEERVQKMGSALERHEGEEVYITEKLEGSSCTFIYRKNGNWLARLFNNDGIFQVCSRNTIVFNSQNGKNRKNSPHYLKSIADRYKIHEKLKSLNRNLALQGESLGPKIQKNIYNFSDYEFCAFLMFDIDKQEYLSFVEMQSLCRELNIPMVPVVGFGKIVPDVKYYVELSKGKSLMGVNINREGIVIRGLAGNFSFKSINPEYLLAERD